MEQKFKARRSIVSVALKIIIVVGCLTCLGVVGGVENGARIYSLLFLLPIAMVIRFAYKLLLMIKHMNNKKED